MHNIVVLYELQNSCQLAELGTADCLAEYGNMKIDVCMYFGAYPIVLASSVTIFPIAACSCLHHSASLAMRDGGSLILR